MDVFNLRERLVSDYASYVRSFINIRDERIGETVVCRKHQTLKTTPAVAANVTDHVWTLEELVGLLDQSN